MTVATSSYTSKRQLLSLSKTPILGVKRRGYPQQGSWSKNQPFQKKIIIRLNIYFVWKITFTFYKTLSKKKLSLSRPRKRPKFVSIKFLPTVLLSEQLISLMWDIFARYEWETSDSKRWCLYWDTKWDWIIIIIIMKCLLHW